MVLPSRVHQLEWAFRDLVNEPSRKNELSQNPERWAVLTTSLDLLNSTELAIAAFSEADPEVETPGDTYLAIYGVLQAMFLQQDAVTSLHKVFGIPFVLDHTLREIRDLRNDVAGHPTTRYDGSVHFFVQPYVSRAGFQLLSLNRQLSPRERWVTMADLVNQQQDAVTSVLTALLSAVDKSAGETGVQASV